MAINGTNYFPISGNSFWANKLTAARNALTVAMAAFDELNGKMGQISSDDATYVELEQACGLTSNGQTGTGVSVGYKVFAQVAAVNTALHEAAVTQFRDQVG